MKRLPVNGVELSLVDEGTGPPILFVHGFPLSQAMWRSQIDALKGSYRAIAPDLRGFGNSNFLAGAGSHLLNEPRVSMEEFADDAASLLDALGVDEPVTYCGLSMGGYVGWQFIRKYPERVARLVICDSRAAADTPEAAKGRGELAKKVLADGSQVAVEGMLGKLLAPATMQNKPDVVEAVRGMGRQASRQGVAAALLGMAARPPVFDLLPTINVPTLLIVGEEDAISTVDEMRGIAEKIPAAEFVIIPDSGHMTPMENAVAFNKALLDFLRR